MKKILAILLLLLIAVGCDDSTESEQPTEQPQPDPLPADPPVIKLPSITNTIGMTFHEIPAGTFMMGSPETEVGRDVDEHQHKVTITKPFYMQTTEVTQGQWKAEMGTEPWKGKHDVKEDSNCAATYVSWDDAVDYCKKLSEKEGKTYRLPTEAEWEYACRAGTVTARSFGNEERLFGDYAWYAKNAWDIDEKYAHQVGLKKSNAFGLYDMHGNVSEWCHDYYDGDYYNQSPAQDPMGPVTGSYRVLRGGSWHFHTRGTRSANRNWPPADSRYGDFGFRVVREKDEDGTASTNKTQEPDSLMDSLRGKRVHLQVGVKNKKEEFWIQVGEADQLTGGSADDSRTITFTRKDNSIFFVTPPEVLQIRFAKTELSAGDQVTFIEHAMKRTDDLQTIVDSAADSTADRSIQGSILKIEAAQQVDPTSPEDE